MEVRDLSLDSIIPYARNPRKNDRAVDKVAASIKEFGWRSPIVVDEKMVILAGHTRYKAAKKLGLTEAPVHIAEGLTDAQKKAYRIADNRVAEEAEWDIDKLKLEVETLGELDFDLDLLGFDDDFLKDLMADPIEEGKTDEDAVPEIEDEHVTVEGDIWLLGKHRLMCGDSTSIDAVEKLTNGTKIDVLFTDPPYGIDFKPQRGTHEKILNDALQGQEFDDFLDGVFSSALAVMKPDTYAFVWTGWPKLGHFEKALQKAFKIQAFHIWVKNNFGIGYYSRPKHEPFYLCLNGKPVYPSVAPADVWEAKKVAKTVHSCEKPVDLIINILDTYHKNSNTLDLFGGSGSTLIACEKTNRNAFLMELDPKYCDVIIKRWQEYTGKQATLEESGKTYDEISSERS